MSTMRKRIHSPLSSMRPPQPQPRFRIQPISHDPDILALVNDSKALLREHEPGPVDLLRHRGGSNLFFTCEHASKRIPESLENLGLDAAHLERHIAWDIGAAGVARRLSEHFDATCVLQNYSRLVVDCNRWTHADDFATTYSEDTVIPGNMDLSDTQLAERTKLIYEPYHQTIEDHLDQREQTGRVTVLASIHTCTPVFLGESRPWHVGVLYQRDTRFAHVLMDLLRSDGTLVVGDNQPYALNDNKDYAVPVHGERRGIAHVEFEIRQDLVANDAGQSEWAERLHELLSTGVDVLEERHPELLTSKTPSHEHHTQLGH